MNGIGSRITWKNTDYVITAIKPADDAGSHNLVIEAIPIQDVRQSATYWAQLLDTATSDDD